MHSTTLFAFLLVGLVTLASSSTPGLQKRSFSVDRAPNPSSTHRNGPRAMAMAYRKFGMRLPSGLVDTLDAQDAAEKGEAPNLPARKRSFRHVDRGTNSRRGVSALANSGLGGGIGGRISVARGMPDGSSLLPRQQLPDAINTTNQTGTTAANPANNGNEFVSPITIGGQPVNLAFDTGSADLWVFNTQLSGASNQGHRVYDPSQSKTFEMMTGAEFAISYGDGSAATGNVGRDVVSVGGAEVPAQAVQLATKVSATFVQDQESDGLMGLSFSQLNTVKPQKQKTYFENIKDTLQEPLFTADLRRGSAGTYTFGSVDQSKFKGDLASIPVNTSMGFWQFSSERFAVNGGPPQAASPGGQAIADTGTTLILADPTIVVGYYSNVPGAQATNGSVTFPCTTKLPDLDLDIGGVYMARIAGVDLNQSPLSNDKTMCFGGLQAVPAGRMGIYGDAFFKSQFVVFNGGNNTLGMAPHA